jgi:HlyD family secretion protein
VWLQGQLGTNYTKSSSVSSQYITAPVEEGVIRRVVTATGTLNAIINVEVGSQLSGQIAEVLVDFNDEVKRRQPLARLDQRSFQARVQEAKAALEFGDANIVMTERKLERIRIDARESEAESNVMKARVDNARIHLHAAQTELQRKQTLQSRGNATAVQLEDAITKEASAGAALREADAVAVVQKHKTAGTGADVRRVESELQSAISSLAQKKALLQLAEIELERTTIRSPIDGVIVGRKVNEGQTLATALEAKTLFVVAGDLHQMQIEANVDEADISMLRVGQQANFTVDAYPGRQFTAEVRQIRKAPEVQQNVVTYTVVLSAANADDLLLPGMTALVRVTVNQIGPIRKVPLAALRFAPKSGDSVSGKRREAVGGKPAVLWLLGKNGLPTPLEVGLGEEDASDVAVVSGTLAKGDLVIVGEAASSAPRQLFGIRLGS